MGQSVVINPSGDPSRDLHLSSQAVLVSSEAGDSGVVSKRSTTYVCQFCGRVCRNAQALGGHMNVHRRERALAKQLLELRNQGEGDLTKGTTSAAATTGVVAVVAAAASGNPPAAGEGTGEQDHLEEEVITHGGSSASSSSSPPSPHAIAIASALVHPWRSLQRLPSKNRKRCEAVDLELRLGFTPGRFL